MKREVDWTYWCVPSPHAAPNSLHRSSKSSSCTSAILRHADLLWESCFIFKWLNTLQGKSLPIPPTHACLLLLSWGFCSLFYKNVSVFYPAWAAASSRWLLSRYGQSPMAQRLEDNYGSRTGKAKIWSDLTEESLELSQCDHLKDCPFSLPISSGRTFYRNNPY